MKSCVAIFACSIAVPALAQPPITVASEAVPSVEVSYADLDLANRKDVDRLRRRVNMAARSLCFDSMHSPLEFETLERACYASGTQRAYNDIDQLIVRRASVAALPAAAQVIVVRVK